MEFWLRERGFVFPIALFITHKEQTGTKQTHFKPVLAHYSFSSVWSLFCNYLEIISQYTGKDCKQWALSCATKLPPKEARKDQKM